jgi:hypothetical protein
MSTLTAIPAAGLRAPVPLAPSNRRLAWGLLVSLLLHALLLSLQFGIPGLRAGAGRPLSVVLAPLPAAPVPPVPPAPSVDTAIPTPAPVATPAPSTPPAAAAQAPQPERPVPVQRHGFTLRDPAPALPAPPTPKPALPARRTPRRRARPRLQPPKSTLHTEVIARQVSDDPSFVLPQPAIPALTDVAEAPVEQAEAIPPQVAQQTEEEGALARADAERELAQQRVAEEEKRLAEQRLAEQRRAEELARQQLAEQQRAQQLAERRQAEETAQQQMLERQRVQQLAEQRRAEELAQEQRAEQQRAQQVNEQRRAEELSRQQLAEQQRAQQVAEQRRAEELARQQLAEQQRAQQLAEQRRAEELARQQLAEQQRAQQLAEQRRAEDLARQQLAEQQRAQQMAEQRLAEEQAQQAAVRQRAEELARRQAAEAEAARRLARQDEAAGQPTAAPDGNVVRADRGAGTGIGQGGSLGGSAGSAGTHGLPGRDFGSRARELLRGIDVAKAVPPVMRAAEQAQQAVRRALADAARHDVPLRLYIDSVRQKIERNAVVSQFQLSSRTVHTDPVVSIAIRSDGSIEDVTILRSSGRPDIDEVVRRTVRLNARYAAFPANVAANYDVIELRRIWTFAEVLRLVEEVR